MTQSDSDQFAEDHATANAEGFFNTWYEKPAMLRLLGDVTGHRILDAGCGSGPTSVALTERGADVSGFDLSAAMIEIARRRLLGTDLQVHDLAEPLPWQDATFNTVVASLVLHYLQDWSGPLTEFHRVLTPGGRGCWSRSTTRARSRSCTRIWSISGSPSTPRTMTSLASAWTSPSSTGQ